MKKEFDFGTVGAKSDLHLHTVVSDGEMVPADIFRCAQQLGLEQISITDHDAIGAYRHFGDVFAEAEKLGITLVSGIELDSYYKGVEIHILGYDLDVNDKPLNDYLSHIHGLRRRRIDEQIVKVNAALGEEVLKRDEIFLPHRDTLMKPHMVHTLLKKGLFEEYREAARWVSDKAPSSILVPEMPVKDMIELVIGAGGKAFMAHPGFYMLEKDLDLDTMLEEFIPLGLTGIEVEYPYVGTSPKFKTAQEEQKLLHTLRQAAEKYKLLTSRGTDAHTTEQLLTLRLP